MADITREEADQFNDDVQCVIERLIEFNVINHTQELHPEVTLASSAAVRQLFHRWFGFEYSLANIQRIRRLRSFIAAMRDAEDSVPPTA